MVRRWWRPVTAAATAVFLLAATATPAGAWPEEGWLTKLDIAKANSISRGSGITVAVVDAGVVGSLGDLSGRVLPGTSLVDGSDGRSDAGEGCNQSGGCYSHGTDMALIIAGTAAGKGFQGIAPQAHILPVKVLARTGGEADSKSIADGIRWAVDHGAQIVNVSLGKPGVCDTDEGTAIKYAYQHNVNVVASSGNDGSAAVSTPGDCPGALAAGATNQQFTRASFSNYGPELAFVAPVNPNVEEALTGAKLPGGSGSGGTSDAAAVVSGTLALIRSHSPQLSARDVITHAIYNVHNGLGKFGVRINDQFGYGEILPYHAMADPLPAGATNPIYDQWAKLLGRPTPGGGPSGSSSSGPSDSASNATSAAPASSSRPAGGKSSSGVPTGVIILIVVVVVAVGAGAAMAMRRRKRTTVGGYPPPH